ncbi:MAG TPA: C4-dicarboxylate transporter DctA [Streptosporangiaceae bacterium]
MAIPTDGDDPGGGGAEPRTGWRRLVRHLYFWVLVGVVAGAVVGLVAPGAGEALGPLGDLFINAIKMIITPIVFLTVVLGIASATNLRMVGRVGLKALVYFEVVSTFALAIGLVVANVVRPGVGMGVHPADLDASKAQEYTSAPHGFGSFLTSLVPDNVVGAFASGDILPVLVFSVLFGIALVILGERGGPVTELLERFQQVFFGILRIIMYAAPIGAFGATAFTTGKYGAHTLGHLGALMACFYVTCAVFVFVVLGVVTRVCGVSLLRLLRYFREELLVVVATVSTETVLPQTMRKLERLGCGKSVVGITIPAGYSFNLDGAAIYLSLASLFIAQATGVHLSLGAQLGLVLILVLTSKGGAGVAGAALAVLAATLSSLGTVPVAGIVLILGVDRFMNEARALTNIVGNVVATIVVSRWENDFDAGRARAELAGRGAGAEPEPALSSPGSPRAGA